MLRCLLTLSMLLTLPVVASANGTCRPCTFAGKCGPASVTCPPSRTRCVPTGGILGFNSLPPNIPAYWTLFDDTQDRSSLRRLDGRLETWADYAFGRPAVPGMPQVCQPPEGEDLFCMGAPGEFSAVVRRDRVVGRARYADGATCTFRFLLAFGQGGERPNRFRCRDATGALLSQGVLRVQLLRVRGCKRASG